MKPTTDSYHKSLRIAIIDMNEGRPNQGMRCIREIVYAFGKAHGINLFVREFDIRVTYDCPDIHFDIFISSGGPGSPLESIGSKWEERYFKFTDSLLAHNRLNPDSPKHLFLICHSFQLFCRNYQLGQVVRRKSTAFGVFPVNKINQNTQDLVFRDLPNPFFTVDSRDWQVVQPNIARITNMGGEVIAIEKERPHVPLERCLMAMRFTPHIWGTQFHPEADAQGMGIYLQQADKKALIVNHHGEEKYLDMLYKLNDPDKIMLTYQLILPRFLEHAAGIEVYA